MPITKHKICEEELFKYTEDEASVEGAKGLLQMVQRQDTLASSTSADGDWGYMKQTAAGELYVKASDTDALLTTIDADTSAIAVDTAAMVVDLAAIEVLLTSIEGDTANIDTNIAAFTKVEDAAAGDAYSGIPIFATRQDTLSSLVDTDGDFGGLKIDALGQLYTTSAISSIDGGVADDAVSTGNPLFVGGISHDQSSALGAVSAGGDRTHLLADLYRRIFVNDSLNVGWQVTAVTAGTTSAQIDATPLAGRTKVLIQNQSNKSVYIKNTTAVADNTSIEIPACASMEFNFGEALPIHIIGEQAGQLVAFAEAA